MTRQPHIDQETVRLLEGRIAIRPDKIEHSSVLWSPDTDNPLDRKRARTGVVIAIGVPYARTKRWFRNGAWHGGVPVDAPIKVGDRVVYKFGQVDTPLPGEPRVAWCSAEEILAVIE